MAFKKGVKFLEEHGRKAIEGIKRRHETHDTPNKGIPHTEETKRKISTSCFKVGVGKWNKGKHYTRGRKNSKTNTD